MYHDGQLNSDNSDFIAALGVSTAAKSPLKNRPDKELIQAATLARCIADIVQVGGVAGGGRRHVILTGYIIKCKIISTFSKYFKTYITCQYVGVLYQF